MSEVRNNEMQILIDIIKAFDSEKFIRFFRDKNRSFAPRAEDLFQYDDDNFRNGKKLGEIQFAQGEKMLICAFQASQPLSERSSKKAQYEKGKKILKDSQSDAGIFIFHDSNNNLRFSLIYAEYLGVKRRFSYFKRLTFFVSPRLTNKTFLQQIGGCDFFSFENIIEAFSVEPVTKQFYGELQYWYFWAMDKIKFPDDYKYSNDPAKDKEIRNATNLIRLITRIIFIRFLTEKGLIPSELFSGEKLGRVVKDFMKGKKTSNFYNAILQNLFFGTLNQKMDERSFADERGYPANMKEYGVKNLYRYADKFLFSKDEVLKLFKDIPFLNGGLFDCLDKDDELNKVIYVDGFSRNPAKQSIIPDYLFFQQEEEKVSLSNYGLGKGRPVRGLIEILNSYNFTIDENTPVDQEIALDPELLGKVFENLLASYNPETATTARKATGSYYTPREIVDYMVQESLLVYLANAINNAPQPPLKLRGGEGEVILPSPLAGEGKGEGWRHSREGGNPEVKELDARLSLSPQVVSWETSGMTDNKEEKIRQLLSYSEEIPEFSAPERKKIISAIDNIKILDPACGSGAFPMGILHKLVYALQKLDPENKYWHELQYQKALKESEEVFKQDDKNERQERLKEINEAFDEGINYPDYARKLYLIENCIYGVDIQPIAIQISKLRFFISLVLDQKVDKSKENLGIRALPNLETKFVAANTLIGLDRPTQLAFKNPDIEKKEEELKRIRHKYFEAKTRKEKLDYQKKDQQLRKDIADLLKHSGWDSSTAEKIAAFDLYDPNISADWFDPEWMFGIKNPSPLAGEGKGEGGFDVVIGNPPYFNISTVNKDLYRYLAEHYKSIHTGYNDIVYYFIYLGIEFLNKTGCCALITSNYYLGNEYARNLRKYLKSHISKIVNFKDHLVFDEASIHTCISISNKDAASADVLFFEAVTDEKITSSDIEAALRAFSVRRSELNDDWLIADQSASSIIGRLHKDSILLGDISTIEKGSTSGKNDVFTISCELAKQKKFEKELLRRNLKNGDIEKYVIRNRGNYLIYVDNHTEIKNFPKIYSYLESCKDALKQRNEVVNKLYPWYRLERPRNKAVFNAKEKIVVPYRAESNRFAYDDAQYFNDGGDIRAIVINDGKVNIKYVLALLNSKLIDWFYGFIGKPKGKVREYFNKPLSLIPIKKISLTEQQPFITLVDQILAAKKKDPNADTSALERKIDKMVYELYGLTEEEIKIVEGKG